MKIIIAPSKTMTKTATTGTTRPLFTHITQNLLSWLTSQSIQDLQQLFSVNETIAKANYERFQNFHEAHHALHAYTGHQFKHLDAQSLDEAAQAFLNDHLLIMSGLYGLVRPTDVIGHYRLPMGVKKDGVFLKDIWKASLSAYLQGETIINLASKEYSDAIDQADVTMIDIVFKKEKQGKLTSHAMENKKMRGKFVHQIALKKADNPQALQTFNIDGYRYQSSMSNTKTMVFIKPEK